MANNPNDPRPKPGDSDIRLHKQDDADRQSPLSDPDLKLPPIESAPLSEMDLHYPPPEGKERDSDQELLYPPAGEKPPSDQELPYPPPDGGSLSEHDLRYPPEGGHPLSEQELLLRPEDQPPPDSEPLTGAPGSSTAVREGDSVFDLESPLTPQPVTPQPVAGGSSFDFVLPPTVPGDPASNVETPPPRDDDAAAIGNLEPVAPIAPASGWLDVDAPAVDPAGVPPKVESSDIFSSGAIPPASPVGGSDVLMATISGPPVKREPPTPPSDVALSFEQPPGGSTIESAGGSGDLPVAEEVSDSRDSLFDSARLAAASADAPDYGATPVGGSEESNILSELSDPGDITIDDSSAVKLESPGVERTLHPSSGTEFDLTIGEDIPPELAEAAAEAGDSGALPVWPKKKPESERTTPELDVDDEGVQPVDPRLKSSDPSSIFDSINDPVVFRKPGETLPDDEDAAVEFTDHPGNDSSGSSSGLFDTGSPSGPPAIRRPTPRPPSTEFELPEPAPMGTEDSGVLDWAASAAEVEETAPSSNILKRGLKAPDEHTEVDESALDAPRSKPAKPPKLPTHGPGDAEGAGSVELDWVSGPTDEKPSLPPPPRKPPTTRVPRAPEEPPARTSPAREPAATRKGGMLGGALVGAALATTAFAGIYFGGLIPNKSASTSATPPPGPGNQLVGSGSPAGPTLPDAAALPGRSRLYTAIGSGDAAELEKAREELKAIAATDDTPEALQKAVAATMYIGVSHEAAGDLAAARKVYRDAVKRFPAHAATFEAAIKRLAANEDPARGVSRRLTPAEEQLLVVVALVLLQDEAPKNEVEAGVHFWNAVAAAKEGKYTEAVELIGKAKAAHVQQAKAQPGRGINPLSDPLEQIFPRACDDLKVYWQLRAAIYSNKDVATIARRDGPARAITELQRRADEGVKSVAELKTATARLTKTSTDLKDATDKATKAEKDLTDAKSLVTKLEKDVKAERDALEKSDLKFLRAEEERKKGDQLVAALAKELQAAKLLPEKFDADALLAAQKSAMTRATGPTLSALMPSGMAAVGGAGLTAGHLADVAERLTKAERAAKAADAKLATETKRLKDEHAADVKKLTDNYVAETKKLMDGYAADATKLKENHAGELKKMTDKFTADTKTLVATHDKKVKELEDSVKLEKSRAESLAAKFKVDLGNAMSPSQALDVWLPLLTDLRRASDAEPALATATKVMTTAPADSEDAAKARTVAGLAHFIRGEMAKAKELFESARSSPAYRAAAGKPWAKAADLGLQSIADPLAAYRQPVTATKIDPRAAARHLDTGVKAYRAGRFADATIALVESTKADPANPIAWYFLGAAKWAAGAAEQAKDDFLQGAEREKFSPLPTRVISDSLTPIQGSARDALNAARP